MNSFASAVLLALLALLQQLDLPAPTGHLSDFAGVVPADRAARIEAIAREVREKSGGEIAIAVLRDIAGRAPNDVATQIGREWKVGAAAQIGDRTRNAGTVILLVPKESSTDGRGHVFIAPGMGAEGYITDAQAGAIQDEALPALRQGDYGSALELMTRRVAEHYGREFGFTLTADPGGFAQPPPQYERRVRQTGGINPILLIIIVFVVMSMLGSFGRGRRRGCGGGGCIPIPIIFPTGGMGGGGWGGGGWGGGGSWGGGGGGGFGGFGGGGGFSGGGAGRDF